MQSRLFKPKGILGLIHIEILEPDQAELKFGLQ